MPAPSKIFKYKNLFFFKNFLMYHWGKKLGPPPPCSLPKLAIRAPRKKNPLFFKWTVFVQFQVKRKKKKSNICMAPQIPPLEAKGSPRKPPPNGK